MRPMTSDKKIDQLECLLRERIKELDCLYSLATLIEQSGDSLDKILHGTVELLSRSWQYPDITCARILFEKQTYQSHNFKMTQWNQSAPIFIFSQHVGTVDVFYLKKKPDHDEGPFLKEERLLINAVSERIGKAAERINIQRQLQVERKALQDVNVAIQESLIQTQREKRMIGVSIQSNFDKIITPILLAMQGGMSSRQMKYVELLKKNIKNIISPFAEKEPEILYKLSPSELLICNMIKHGLSTKEISNMRRISPSTVNRHRENIRRKLGLTNCKVNLISYLNNIEENST